VNLERYSVPERKYPASIGPSVVRIDVTNHVAGGVPYKYGVSLTGFGHASVILPSGERPITPTELLELRGKVLQRLGELDLHPERELTPVQRTTWDRVVGASLVELLEVHSFQAFDEEFWTYMTMHVFWDFPNWRFPGKKLAGRSESDSEHETDPDAIGLKRAEDRVFGGRRNVLFRVWLRAHVLGPDLAIPERSAGGGAINPAGEDVLDNLFGRPSISRNHELAKAIMSAFYRNAPTGSGRHLIFREFMKAIRRRNPTLHFTAMGAELGSFLDNLWQEAVSRVDANTTT
jgi:hypothetical protein